MYSFPVRNLVLPPRPRLGQAGDPETWTVRDLVQWGERYQNSLATRSDCALPDELAEDLGAAAGFAVGAGLAPDSPAGLSEEEVAGIKQWQVCMTHRPPPGWNGEPGAAPPAEGLPAWAWAAGGIAAAGLLYWIFG